MVDNVHSDDAADLAFLKIERKRKKERVQREVFRRKQHELRTCQDLEDQKDVGSKLLTLRMKIKEQHSGGRRDLQANHGKTRRNLEDRAAEAMGSSRAEESYSTLSDCDVNEEIDDSPMDIGNDAFDGGIHGDVSLLPSLHFSLH